MVGLAISTEYIVVLTSGCCALRCSLKLV